jgi:uncharacterized protein (DUF2345 family)
MVQNVQKSKGRPSNYKQDRGGTPAEFGPFTGIVMSSVDPTRAGRLRVFIEAFADGGPEAMEDESKWTTVSYMPAFFGSTPVESTDGANSKIGAYPGNPNSYGMWFTPPDIGVTVVCIFVNGDRSQGYYIGVIPEDGLGNQVPAGAAGGTSFEFANKNQEEYFANATRLPVTEININNEALFNDPRFYDGTKPVHSYVAQGMFQQGLIDDIERGTITSSSQRETPSAVFGISTPGLPIFQGGMKPNDIRQKLNDGSIKPSDAKIIGRVGGHSLVMDDGNLEGDNALIRLRTTKGHQITMSDTGNFFYIIHANGQTWLEFGVEGTVDVFSTNSINLRTNGDINLHADRDINMFAGRNFKVKSNETMEIESVTNITMSAQTDITIYSKATVGVKADGTLALDSKGGSWGGGQSLIFKGDTIDLNGPAPTPVTAPNPIVKTKLDDTKFSTAKGWQAEPGTLESIVNRAPTHEPYPYHNLGVDVETAFEPGPPTPPPGAEPVPAGIEIVAK